MRNVFSTLKHSSPCSSCPPVLSDGECAEGSYYANESFSGAVNRVIGTGVIFLNGPFAEYTSTISYDDAVNNALYESMRLALAEVGEGGPNFFTWPENRENTEVSFTANCPCGWTGDPLTVTLEAGVATGFWTVTQANLIAYNIASSQAIDNIICTEPTL